MENNTSILKRRAVEGPQGPVCLRQQSDPGLSGFKDTWEVSFLGVVRWDNEVMVGDYFLCTEVLKKYLQRRGRGLG